MGGLENWTIFMDVICVSSLNFYIYIHIYIFKKPMNILEKKWCFYIACCCAVSKVFENFSLLLFQITQKKIILITEKLWLSIWRFDNIRNLLTRTYLYSTSHLVAGFTKRKKYFSKMFSLKNSNVVNNIDLKPLVL